MLSGPGQDCFRIPPGVVFARWTWTAPEQGPDAAEWVVYHSGTGETLRLSPAAVAVLDHLEQSPNQDAAALSAYLNTLLDIPLPAEEIRGFLEGVLGQLLAHECVERRPCD